MSDGRSFERLPPNGRRTAAACDWEVCKFDQLDEALRQWQAVTTRAKKDGQIDRG